MNLKSKLKRLEQKALAVRQNVKLIFGVMFYNELDAIQDKSRIGGVLLVESSLSRSGWINRAKKYNASFQDQKGKAVEYLQNMAKQKAKHKLNKPLTTCLIRS